MSSVREVDLETGDVLRQKVLATEDFAEGVTRLNGRWAFQLSMVTAAELLRISSIIMAKASGRSCQPSKLPA